MKAINIEDNLKELFKRFSSSKTKASELMEDKEKTKKKLNEAYVKASKNKENMGSIWDQFQILLSLAKDYFNGSYKDISKNSILAIVAGMLYFLSPVDLIPDFILGFGLIDDVFILGLVIKQVSLDIQKYQKWKVAKELIKD